jgi:hypothetical protein
MSDAYGVTRSTDLHGLNIERVAYLAGAMDVALQLPFLYATPTKSLQVTFYPIEAPGPHRRKTVEGAAPNPRKLKKGIEATFNKVTLEGSLALSRLAQIGLDPSITELELLRALGASAGWGIHIEAMDYLMNDAFTVNGADGVPFFSASHPSEIGLQSNRLESSLDAAALKSGLVMLSKTRGHDGQYVGQGGGYVLTPSDLGPSAWEIVQPGTSTTPSLGAGAVAGPSYIGSRGLSVLDSPCIEDTDAWAIIGRNARLEAYVADPSSPKIENIVGTRDRIASDELTFVLGARNWRGFIGAGPA